MDHVALRLYKMQHMSLPGNLVKQTSSKLLSETFSHAVI